MDRGPLVRVFGTQEQLERWLTGAIQRGDVQQIPQPAEPMPDGTWMLKVRVDPEVAERVALGPPPRRHQRRTAAVRRRYRLDPDRLHQHGYRRWHLYVCGAVLLLAALCYGMGATGIGVELVKKVLAGAAVSIATLGAGLLAPRLLKALLR